MNEYTAEEIASLLSKEDPKMSLRTVRYYRQCKFIPDLPISNITGKPVYTDEHVAHFRAIRTLSKTGESLEEIRGKLTSLNLFEVNTIANESSFYNSVRLIEHETISLHPDVSVTLSRSIKPELKERIIQQFSKILKEEFNYD